MRNPNRILDITNLIYEIWLKQPDLRFNQLMANLQWEYSEHTNYPLKELWEKDEYSNRDIHAYRKLGVVDLFNVEDDYFLLFLKNKLKELEGNS